MKTRGDIERSVLPWRRADQGRNGDLRLSPISAMRLDWDRMFDRFLDDAWAPLTNPTQEMLLDLTETDDEIRVRAELPGVDPKDIDLSLSGDELTIAGRKVEDEEERDGARTYSERRFGAYQRTIKLPCPVHPDKVEAEHQNGVVTIQLRKAESVRPKRIAIKHKS